MGAFESWLKPRPTLLTPPLRDRTREERKNLLLASAIGLVIARAGLVPSKISFLGVEFTNAQANSLLRIAAAAVGYFIVAFMIYALSDWLIWRMEIYASRFGRVLPYPESVAPGADPHDAYLLADIPKKIGISTYIATTLLGLFEFVLPLAIGVFAIVSLWSRAS